MAAVEKNPSEEVRKPELHTRRRIAWDAATAVGSALMVIISLFIMAALMTLGKSQDNKYLVGFFFVVVVFGVITAMVETHNAIVHAITRHETMMQAMHGLPLEDLD